MQEKSTQTHPFSLKKKKSNNSDSNLPHEYQFPILKPPQIIIATHTDHIHIDPSPSPVQPNPLSCQQKSCMTVTPYSPL